MAKIRHGGYVFLSRISDHDPRHVHVYQDGKFIVKWDLESGKVMKGEATERLRRLIRELQTRKLL